MNHYKVDMSHHKVVMSQRHNLQLSLTRSRSEYLRVVGILEMVE